jgi:hypothetical protein
LKKRRYFFNAVCFAYNRRLPRKSVFYGKPSPTPCDAQRRPRRPAKALYIFGYGAYVAGDEKKFFPLPGVLAPAACPCRVALCGGVSVFRPRRG